MGAPALQGPPRNGEPLLLSTALHAPVLTVKETVKESGRRILVIKFRNIGDVLLTAPLISTLRLAYPRAHIAALVRPGTEPMLAGHPHIDELMSYPVRHSGEGRLRFWLRHAGWLRELRRKRFDLVITTTEGDRGMLYSLVTGAPARRGVLKAGRKGWGRRLLTEPCPPLPGPRHTVIRNLDLARDLAGTAQTDRRVRLAYAPEDLLRVRRLLADAGWDRRTTLVQVHATSRWFFKCWQDAAMARVIDHLQHRPGLRVVLTSGPEARETARVQAILRLCKTAPIDLSGQLDLKQTAALSSLCRLFFGVDTAPMHMAAALDVPVVALFGPSGAFDWGPWPNGWAGAATPYPLRNGVQHAGAHTVIQKPWTCVPCGQDGCQGSKRSACLDELHAGRGDPAAE